MRDLIILGSGPAGLTAAIYASRYNIKPLIIARDLGIATESHRIDNYPGIYGVTGLELIQRFQEHAKKLGAELVTSEILSIKKTEEGFKIKTSEQEFEAKAIIYALGGKKNKLGIPGEKELVGKGVSYCATCDAPFYKEKNVAVIGGSDSALQSALLLAKFANKVYIVYRRAKFFRPFPALVNEIENNKKIETIFNHVPIEIKGKEKVESIIIQHVENQKKQELAIDGVFIEIGHEPNTELVADMLDLDENKRIKVNADMSTSMPGLFAAGDCTNGSNMLDQIVTAAAEGAIAATTTYRYLTRLKTKK